MRLEFRMQKRATGPYDEIIVSRWNLKFVAFMYENSFMSRRDREGSASDSYSLASVIFL